jgi:hypothetical protein
MAQSPAHKLGQMIGDVLESAILRLLKNLAVKHKLYLDHRGERPARQGRKVEWKDQFGNVHDLDFVLERGGTPERFGAPAAFIESAWRSYTKHSRNKAQEIQGAILPLVAAHRNAAPFVGVVLGGEFTTHALRQLQSNNFATLFFPRRMIEDAFRYSRYDVRWGEKTSDRQTAKKVRALGKMTSAQRQAIGKRILRANSAKVREFVSALERAILRRISSIGVLPLHGTFVEIKSVAEAISFLRQYKIPGAPPAITKYEVCIRYDNGDCVETSFKEKKDAMDFLRSFLPAELHPQNRIR